MAKIRNKKRVILKGFAAFIYAISVVFICAGIVGTHSLKNDSFKNKEAVNNNLTKTVSTKELITSYETLSKKVTTTKTTTTKKTTTTTTKTTTTNVVTAPKGEIQSFAHDLVVGSYGWTEGDFTALVKLWNRESGWNPNSHSASGACGIPQALPCSKIAAAYGENTWENQIKWGLKYISGRYGTPLNAWASFQSQGWY